MWSRLDLAGLFGKPFSEGTTQTNLTYAKPTPDLNPFPIPDPWGRPVGRGHQHEGATELPRLTSASERGPKTDLMCHTCMIWYHPIIRGFSDYKVQMRSVRECACARASKCAAKFTCAGLQFSANQKSGMATSKLRYRKSRADYNIFIYPYS